MQYSKALLLLVLGVALLLSGCAKGSQGTEILINGNFSLWSQGDNKSHDGWTLGGPGAGSVGKDTAVFRDENAGAKVIMSSGEAVALFQDIEGFEKYAGKKVILSCWARVSKPGSVLLALHDGNKWINSGPHTGSGQWELLTLEGNLSDKPTKLRAHIWVKNNETANFDSASLKIQ